MCKKNLATAFQTSNPVYRPEGAHAVVTTHGKFQGIWDAGIHMCLPWTRIQFLVTAQSIVYDLPVKACPTYDNIFVQIDICVTFKVKAEEQDVKNFVYKISINQLNEQLEAAVTERVRVLARSKTHLEVYQLKGTDQVRDIKDTLNSMFEDKGLHFERIIIKNVILPQDIAQPLDVKAQYNSLNEYEREKHKFELQKINDNETLQLIRQKK